MSTGPFLLLPPSEAKASGGDRDQREGAFDVDLSRARKEVRAALRDLLRTSDVARLERVMNVRGPHLDRAVSATSALVRGRADLMPAWRRYTGVVWGHMDVATMTTDEFERILVPSGVYGVTTANDHIADYRLKMNVRLASIGQVAAFWRPRLTPVLSKRLADEVVVNLLPKEHQAAIDLETLAGRSRVITVGFRVRGGERAVGHDAKAVKGILARCVLDNGVDVFDGFEWGGWRSSLVDDSAIVEWRGR